MSDIAHPDATPRNVSLMIALHLARADAVSAQRELVELIAWLAFDRPACLEAQAPPVRVLIVERCAASAHVKCVLFSHLGHTARSAYTEQDAVTMVGDFTPDVVLLDLDRRDVGERDVVRAMRARCQSTYIVGVSGQADVRRASAMGVDWLLTKPVDLAKIRRLLAGRR